jgi:hypothetical protein
MVVWLTCIKTSVKVCHTSSETSINTYQRRRLTWNNTELNLGLVPVALCFCSNIQILGAEKSAENSQKQFYSFIVLTN